MNNAFSAVVNLMNPGHVEAVFVRGAARKWAGRLVGVNLSQVLETVRTSRDLLLRRAGYDLNLVGSA
jgi:hypothetical protein